MTYGLTGEVLSHVDKVRFHTPSHSGKLDENLLRCDVTELSYSDNLLSPTGKILELEQKLAFAYGAEASFISTQGATHNIFQGVFALKDDGAFLIVGTCHASVYNAMRVLNAKAYHVDELTLDTVIPDDVRTVIITAPDYEGRVYDFEKVMPLIKANGKKLFVDSAHGAHFAFCSKLPVSVSEYADLAVYSLHKTLAVATGGSVLAVKNTPKEKFYLARKLLHTTSPSYITLCSIESAIEDCIKNGEQKYCAVLDEIEKFARGIKEPFFVKPTDDKTRLVISSSYDGRKVSEILFEKGFVAETVIGKDVVFIVNFNNYQHLGALLKAVNGIGVLPQYVEPNFPKNPHPKPTLMEFGGDMEEIDLSKAEGRKAYLEIGFYPPGAPLVYSHDEIKREHIEYLSDVNNLNYVFGLENGRVFVLK